MIGIYRNGLGKASRCMDTLAPDFGYPVFGTMNFQVNESIERYAPCLVTEGRRYWLVKLSGAHYGWAYRWSGSKQPSNVIEVVSKALLPDSLKTGYVDIEVCEPWAPDAIRTWAAKQYWFQSFPWGPQRADSTLVWDTIAPLVDWQGKTVLDIGCNYGRFSFEAAKRGARVTGVDKDKPCIEKARTINDHIEMQDVRFQTDQSFGVFDVIFYLSVHHQFDPDYSGLKNAISDLRAQARLAVFVELIVPDLAGKRTVEQIDAMVGGEVLRTYRHKVRCNRRIYRVNGILP